MELNMKQLQQQPHVRRTAQLIAACLLLTLTAYPQTDTIRVGYSMRVMIDNAGQMGRQAYPGGSPSVASGRLGMEYPIGDPFEHLFGSGIWVGGLLDTARVGTSPPVRAVSTAYEGWSGPLNEFFPDNRPSDSIWTGSKNNPTRPAGWDAYWLNPSDSVGYLDYRPIADQETYMVYRDNRQRVTGHVPLNLKVIQRNYAWNDPYADAIMIVEYTIYNVGTKPIDSTYIGFFFEADVGPNAVPLYYQRNFTGYYANSRTAYVHNPSDRGSTPAGLSFLRRDSLRYAFRWYPGPQSPTPDSRRYEFMSSGRIDPDEFPNLSDTRFLFSVGPFTLRPYRVVRDSLRIAVAVLSGKDPAGNHLRVLQRNAARALDIYFNQGIRLPATPPSPPLRVEVGFRKVKLNWRWTPADSLGPNGRPNPERNWDKTNQVARRYPFRYIPPEPGFPADSGGRNFSAYKIWRSENPDSPDESFTLIKQVDEPRDSFEFNTGLEYEFIDSNLVRGKTYVYSVTSKSIPNLALQQIVVGGVLRTVEVPIEPLESSKSTNKVRVDLPFSVSTKRGEVAVVPNPYRTDRSYTLENGGYEGLTTSWEETKRLVKFINLPERCTIKIYSLAGDLVRTVEHDGSGGTGGFAVGDRNVELVSESNRALASGIYIFTVESPYGIQTGKFVIIR